MIERSKSRDGAARLRQFVVGGIDGGQLKPGARLPTERQLVARFGTARSAARRMLAQLEAEGYITRSVGRGTFVATREAGDETGRLRTLLDGLEVSPAELMDARLQFESRVVEMAVIHATADDFARMDLCLERAERGATLDEFELWDAALHQAIAAATHNRLVVAIFDLFTLVRQQAEWGKLKDRIVTPERRIEYQRQHRRLVQALRLRDADQARAAVVAHLDYAKRNLFGQ
jgi:DNA-binding FadR family transcriptional regulator